MASVWDKSDRDRLFARIDRLTADARPKWGKFDAAAMLAHLADVLKAAIGELQVAPRKTPFRRPLIKQLIVYLIPFPKGVPTVPEFLRSSPVQFEEERASVKDLLMRYATESRKSFPEHPAFGRLSRRAWGVLVYRHFDHHLRQFGV